MDKLKYIFVFIIIYLVFRSIYVSNTEKFIESLNDPANGKFILPTNNTNQTINTNNYSGRYICIKPAASGDGFTGISQIIVKDSTGTNIAKDKPIYVTSVLTWSNTTSNPSAVVDGSTTARGWPNFWHNGIGVNDFIEIDLGKVFAISSIQILTRNDGFFERIPNTRIEINSTSLQKKNVQVMMTEPDGSIKPMQCNAEKCKINCNITYTPSGCVLVPKN